MKKLINVLKHANLHEFVKELKDGINTNMEVGDRFSGGQKQRIGITELYKDPEILILDEFTSSLDPATEKKIIDELNS